MFSARAQTEQQCGTLHPQNLSEVINFIDNLTEVSTTASTLNTTYRIPINLVLVTDEDGEFYYNDLTETEILSDFAQALGFTNALFSDNYEFFLCSHVVSSPSPHLSNINLDNEQDKNNLAAISYSNRAVNIYVVLDVIGLGPVAQAIFPWNPTPNNMIAMEYIPFATSGDFVIEGIGRTIAHELGHYLGLLHSNTFASPTDDCFTTGDLMCDTPTDPSNAGFPGVECTGNCTDGINCVFPQFNYVYNTFIRNNVMYSLLSTCNPTVFEDDQRERMRNVLFGAPARWFLVQSPATSCTDYLERDGLVYRVRVDDGEENFDAFPAVNVDFDDLSNGGVPLCTPVTNIVGQYSVRGFNSPCDITQQSGDVSYLPRGENPDNSNFDPANGVTTFDVIQIQKHILNVALLTSPFRKIAADVNNSGTITTLDVILIRKLILGIISEFNEVDSWRFVPALGELDGIFWNDFYDDPFTASWSAPDGSMRSYLSSAAPSYLDEVDISPSSPLAYFDKVWTFYAIKSGDVTENAQVDLNGVDDEGSTILFTETKTSTEILANGIDTDEVLVASVSVEEGEAFGLDGYQFSINFDDASLELLAIEPGDIAFSSEDFVVDYGGADASIRTLWVNLKATPETVTENDAFFSLVFRPKTNLFTMNGLVSFGGANDFKDLVVSSSDKLDIVNLQVNYKKANVKDFIIKRAYGNPFSGSDNLHLSIEMRELKDVSILLQDSQGGSVMLNYDDLIIGENEIEIATSLVSFLQNGSIFYTIATDEQVQSGTIIKL